MLTGEIRSQVDRIWDAFWTGGISNPLEVIEQLTYLLFIKRLDEVHTRRESRANLTGKPIENPIFKAEPYKDENGNEINEQEYRWSVFTETKTPADLYNLIDTGVFPFLRRMGAKESAFAKHMENARLSLPPEKASLLTKVVDMLNEIDMDDRDTKGDLYEYLLSKLSTAGQNGQFRTPRHIIKMMVQMMAPTPDDVICDPACGTAGFLVAAAEHLYDQHHSAVFSDQYKDAYSGSMFHGFDFDSTMLRIASMNLIMNGIDNPTIENRDSLSEDHSQFNNEYSLILANPPFKGSLDYESTAADLLKTVKTKKTELLFLALFIRLLKPGGRAAVVVPDGVLFGSSKAHKTIRQALVDDHKLDGIVSMPSGVFKPYAGVSTAILFFTKTNSGGTDEVWFYDMQADGYSLDDKRTPLGGQRSVVNGMAVDDSPTTDHQLPTTVHQTHDQNNIPDILTRWQARDTTERDNPRTAQSFTVPRAEIAKNGYDLSINRYKEIVYEEIAYDPPLVILAELEKLEAEIQQGMAELKGMIS
ncbi:MAG: class I SAM-dependent DNA methyltransferase [Chloroflexota bacterium]